MGTAGDAPPEGRGFFIGTALLLGLVVALAGATLIFLVLALLGSR